MKAKREHLPNADSHSETKHSGLRSYVLYVVIYFFLMPRLNITLTCIVSRSSTIGLAYTHLYASSESSCFVCICTLLCIRCLISSSFFFGFTLSVHFFFEKKKLNTIATFTCRICASRLSQFFIYADVVVSFSLSCR